MKKTLLFLLVSNFAIGQQTVQINFVSGFNINVVNSYPMNSSVGTSTNNTAFNVILNNHSINNLVDTFTYGNQIIFADYNGTNINSFISDLLANSNITSVKICPQLGSNIYVYADRLYLTLNNNSNGNPIGTNTNGNIITTNSVLNSIFDTYNVKIMNPLIPNQPWYYIYFDGLINLLRTELINLNSLVSNLDYVGVVMLLSTNQFDSSKPSISPNPFISTINIETNENILTYSVFDITGKQIISSNLKSDFDSQTAQINSGIYLLKLEFESGQFYNQKLIKN